MNSLWTLELFHTLWLVDQHQAAQQRGEGEGEEGGVRVRVSPQELVQEDQDRGQAGRGGVSFELQKFVTVECEDKRKEMNQENNWRV